MLSSQPMILAASRSDTQRFGVGSHLNSLIAQIADVIVIVPARSESRAVDADLVLATYGQAARPACRQ